MTPPLTPTDIVLIENCDFESSPVGGQLTFAKHLLKLFGNRLSLVGVSNGREPVGQWCRRTIGGSCYNYFAVGQRHSSANKPRIPARFKFYWLLKKHRRHIQRLGARYAFLISPEALLAVHQWRWESICFRYSGVENPLVRSRYRWARPLAPLFDRMHFRSLGKAQTILAAADEQAIQGLVARSNGLLTREAIVQLPTAVDTDYFHPSTREESRALLGLGGEFPLIITSGRISQVKGWRFLLEAFRVFRKSYPDSRFMFVGDGEDRSQLSDYITRHNLAASVCICGLQLPEKVSQYLNAADLVVIGSEKEGWCTSLLEALACGKAVVSTDVSGARDLIQDGRNGFVVARRDPAAFSGAMTAALSLHMAGETSLSIASQYSLTNLGLRLADSWEPLRQAG